MRFGLKNQNAPLIFDHAGRVRMCQYGGGLLLQRPPRACELSDANDPHRPVFTMLSVSGADFSSLESEKRTLDNMRAWCALDIYHENSFLVMANLPKASQRKLREIFATRLK
jgi:hypothetical protein